jgi:hypothetical protein
MILSIDQLRAIYSEIQQSALEPGLTLVIFVAADCDSLAALRILTVIANVDSFES